MRFLLLAFIAMPIIEMMVLFEVGAQIGAFNTILLVLLTAMIGVSLLKKQGLHTLMNANRTINQGGIPLAEMGEGLLLAVAGALLLTPGFVTDTIGFLLLTPGVRKVLAKQVLAKLVASQQSMNAQSGRHYGAPKESDPVREDVMDPRHAPFQPNRGTAQDVEEADFTEIRESKDP